jgi:hypothetical protein
MSDLDYTLVGEVLKMGGVVVQCQPDCQVSTKLPSLEASAKVGAWAPRETGVAPFCGSRLQEATRSDLGAAWADYVAAFAPWLSFWSLTFSEKDRTHDVTRDEAVFLWRRLVQSLNRRLYGNHYTRIVGHCYFSYALAFEYQTRGALHMHALVDRRTDWEFINKIWRHMAGIVKIVPVENAEGVSRYLSKYVTKGGELVMYRAKVDKEPAFKPLWYLG